MKFSKILIFVFICFTYIFLFNNHLFGQNFTIESFGGHSYFVEKNAGGYDLGIGLFRTLTTQSRLGLSISHSYNDVSPLPADLTAAKIVLKEESNRLPLGFGWPEWDEDGSWPKFHLEEQPNRYFRFNLGLHYALNSLVKKHHHFTFALGGLISYRDESEMIKLVETSKIRGFIFVRPTDDHSIPIFNYNTYIDAGLKCDVTYLFKKFKSIDLGYRASFMYYPKSGDVMINNGLVVAIRQ
jgi:hypothetical protein